MASVAIARRTGCPPADSAVSLLEARPGARHVRRYYPRSGRGGRSPAVGGRLVRGPRLPGLLRGPQGAEVLRPGPPGGRDSDDVFPRHSGVPGSARSPWAPTPTSSWSGAGAGAPGAGITGSPAFLPGFGPGLAFAAAGAGLALLFAAGPPLC